MTDADRYSLRLRLHRALMRYEVKLLRRLDEPLTVIYRDGSEEDFGPPQEAVMDTPMLIRYKWALKICRKEVIALRFGGTGHSVDVGVADELTVTWTSGIDA